MRLIDGPLGCLGLGAATGTTILMLVLAGTTLGNGFQLGNLLATDTNRIYSIDPQSGITTILLSQRESLGDIVYNHVTQSAFFIEGSNPGSPPAKTIFELSWDAGARQFDVIPFLTDVMDVSALAVDEAGDLYFNQRDRVNHRIWKADTSSGRSAPITESPSPFGFLFTPHALAVTPDSQRLVIATVPSNNLETATVPGGDLERLLDDASWPMSVDVGADGTIYFTEGGPGDELQDRISILRPSAADAETYALQPWMGFLGTGFWGDVEFDDRSGKVYAAKGRSVHELDANLNHRELFEGFHGFIGLDLIESFRFKSADFDQDGDVDGLDYAAWVADFGCLSNCHVDVDHDDDTDGHEFLAWQRQQSTQPAGLGAAAVPEPTSALLAMLVIAGVGRLRVRHTFHHLRQRHCLWWLFDTIQCFMARNHACVESGMHRQLPRA